jgi:hypothetical protein
LLKNNGATDQKRAMPPPAPPAPLMVPPPRTRGGGGAGGGGGGLIAKAPVHLVRAVYAWPLLSPRAKRSRSRRQTPKRGPLARCRAAHSRRPKGMRHATALCLSGPDLGSPPCVRRLQVAGGGACVGTRCWGPRRAGAGLGQIFFLPNRAPQPPLGAGLELYPGYWIVLSPRLVCGK